MNLIITLWSLVLIWLLGPSITLYACLSFRISFPICGKYPKYFPSTKRVTKMNWKITSLCPFFPLYPKYLKKIVYEQIYSYFTRNHLFHENLHGYRSHSSTQTALLQMYERWSRAAHEGMLSGVVLLDLSSAFDLVDPRLLLKKLKIYNFDRYVLAWIESYLSQRSQAVWVDSVLSQFLPCPIGVPQGSNLGPLLFLI